MLGRAPAAAVRQQTGQCASSSFGDDAFAALGEVGSWPAILADLDLLPEIEIERDGAASACALPRARSLPCRAAGAALDLHLQLNQARLTSLFLEASGPIIV